MSSDKVDFWTAWAAADWKIDSPEDDGTILRTHWLGRLCCCGKKPTKIVSWNLHSLFKNKIYECLVDANISSFQTVERAISNYNKIATLQINLVPTLKGMLEDMYARSGVDTKLPLLIKRYNSIMQELAIDEKISADTLVGLSAAKNHISEAFISTNLDVETFEKAILDASKTVNSFNEIAEALKEKRVGFKSFVQTAVRTKLDDSTKETARRAMGHYNAIIKKRPELKAYTITARGLGI